MKSMHRESPLLPASSRKASLPPLLAKQDHAIPGLSILIVEADACMTNSKEWTESKQSLCCDSQVSKATPKWQCHGLSPTHPELLCRCHFVPAQQFQSCETIGRGVKPWTPSSYNLSDAAETPLQAAIPRGKEPIRISVLWTIHAGTQETTGKTGWTADWLAQKHEKNIFVTAWMYYLWSNTFSRSLHF